MTIRSINDYPLKNQRVLIREDLNVPIKNGKVINDARINAALPTIRYALQEGAVTLLMSHLGRPQEGVPISAQAEFSMAPVAQRLGELLGQTVAIMPPDFSQEDSLKLAPGTCVLLENVRTNVGEKANEDSLASYYAGLCDIFVMDAFGTAHRAQASTHGVARFAEKACAGPLLKGELNALDTGLDQSSASNAGYCWWGKGFQQAGSITGAGNKGRPADCRWWHSEYLFGRSRLPGWKIPG